MRSTILPVLAAAALLSLAGTAAAQQRQGGQMQNMPGMDHSQMQGTPQSQGMDMNAMMARCTQMRQQVRPGAAQSADAKQMLAQCDQMDRSMGMTPPRR